MQRHARRSKSGSVSAIHHSGTNLQRTLLAGAVSCALALSVPHSALGTTYTVTNNGDNGPGTLRQAVVDANADTVSPTIIDFQAGVASPITLTGGSIAVSNSMTINGPGSGSLTVSGNNASQIFAMKTLTSTPIVVSISGVTLTGGNAGSSSGGAVSAQGVDLTLSNTTIAGNTTAASGGGIYALDAALTINGSTISGNTAAGAATNTGGGVYALNTVLTVTQSLISGNVAHSGGGLTVNNPIYRGSSGLLIQYSTISHNITNPGQGAGIFISVDNNYAATLTNDTIVGNKSSGAHAYGGGVYSNVGHSGTAVLSIESSTIANNGAAIGGGVFNNPYTHALIHNSIVANNSAADPDLYGNFKANFCLIRNPNGVTFNAGSSNNLTTLDPQLGSFGYYGGPTPTMLPLSGSPIIDVGDPGATTLTTDQRGDLRVVNAHIDIGADERQASEDTIFLDSFEGY
jgi:hypothetical protein